MFTLTSEDPLSRSLLRAFIGFRKGYLLMVVMASREGRDPVAPRARDSALSPLDLLAVSTSHLCSHNAMTRIRANPTTS